MIAYQRSAKPSPSSPPPTPSTSFGHGSAHPRSRYAATTPSAMADKFTNQIDPNECRSLDVASALDCFAKVKINSDAPQSGRIIDGGSSRMAAESIGGSGTAQGKS